MSTNRSQVPLHCSICPKKPNFSDVSHLLTHIASKSHLSHYYKVKIRAATDHEARSQVNQYDHWYDHFDVETLMAERLAIKDEKKTRQDKSQASRLTKRQKPVPAPAPAPAPASMPPPNPSAIDPQLPFATSSFQTPGPARDELFTPSYDPETPCPVLPRTQRPRLHLWPTNRATSSYAIPLEPSSPLAHATNFNLAPFPPMHLRNPSETFDAIAEDEVPVISEAARLKGTLWPGMDIFDAAPPEARRRRNQKKQTSVVERLKSYSAEVEPNEMIWTPAGSLWKERPITGQVDFESSPYKLDSTSSDPPSRKKRVNVAKRVPLAEKDVNIQLKTSMLRGAAALTSMTFDTITAQPAAPSPKKRKRKINVHDEREEQPSGNQHGMRMLTSGFHFNAQQYQHQQPPPPPSHAPHQVLDTNFAAFYQPALQQGYYTAYDPRRPPVYPFPFYAPYGHMGYDLPGFFSYPPPAPQPEPIAEQQQVVEEEYSAGDLPEEEEDDDSQPWDVKIFAEVDVLPSP